MLSSPAKNAGRLPLLISHGARHNLMRQGVPTLVAWPISGNPLLHETWNGGVTLPNLEWHRIDNFSQMLKHVVTLSSWDCRVWYNAERFQIP